MKGLMPRPARWRVLARVLSVELGDPAGIAETFTADYAAKGGRVVIRWPFDWRIPRTSGLNTATWQVADDGSLQFRQVDDAPREPWLAVPWTRLGD